MSTIAIYLYILPSSYVFYPPQKRTIWSKHIEEIAEFQSGRWRVSYRTGVSCAGKCIDPIQEKDHFPIFVPFLHASIQHLDKGKSPSYYTSSSPNSHGGKLVHGVAVVALLGAMLSWLTMLFSSLTASMTVIVLRCPPGRGHACRGSEISLIGVGSPISSCSVRNPGGAWLSGISSRLSSSSKPSATSSIAIGALSSAS